MKNTSQELVSQFLANMSLIRSIVQLQLEVLLLETEMETEMGMMTAASAVAIHSCP